MILKDNLRKVVKLQKAELKLDDTGISRTILPEIDLDVSHAVILSGIRRCGKSTLLKQIMKKLKNCYYFNFEDQRATGFEVSDFEKLDEVFHESGDSRYYLFDEIQNVASWERFVRSKLDLHKKFVVTGSNASLLSRELGTKLTGRHLTYELFPFSYKEMLRFVKKKPSVSSFKEYLTYGGFPEYLKSRKTELLQELLNDIITRDIIVRYGLREAKTLKDMAIHLLTNPGKEFIIQLLEKTVQSWVCLTL